MYVPFHVTVLCPNIRCNHQTGEVTEIQSRHLDRIIRLHPYTVAILLALVYLTERRLSLGGGELELSILPPYYDTKNKRSL